FPDNAADAVTLHGITGSAHGNCHAEPCTVLVVAACCHREESVTKAPAARVGGVELRLAPQTLVRRESEPVHIFAAPRQFDQRCRATGPSMAAGRPGVAALEVGAFPGPFLRDQLPPPLGATTGEHLTAILGRHACPEPVRALTAHFARLIGTLHTKAP